MPALRAFHVHGFKSLRTLDLDLGPFQLVIGANGAGKSNLLDAFRLAAALAEDALDAFVAAQGGANALLHYGAKTTGTLRLGLRWADEACDLDLAFRGDDRLAPPTVRPTKRLREIAVYHFADVSPKAPVRLTGALHDNARLRPDGANLAAVLYRLQTTHPGVFELLHHLVQRAFPTFGAFALRPNPLNAETIRLEWHERHADYRFGPHQLSDGTLRFICLLTMLLQPEPPATLLVDEPELGLHPAALDLLTGCLRSASHQTQILVATHAPQIVNAFAPEDVVTVDRVEGVSVFRRLTTGALEAWLHDYSLGTLWEKNLLGGYP